MRRVRPKNRRAARESTRERPGFAQAVSVRTIHCATQVENRPCLGHRGANAHPPARTRPSPFIRHQLFPNRRHPAGGPPGVPLFSFPLCRIDLFPIGKLKHQATICSSVLEKPKRPICFSDRRTAAGLVLLSRRDTHEIHTLEARPMKMKLIIHEAEEGGFWAEVPGFPGLRLGRRYPGRSTRQHPRRAGSAS
jgi:hypothetical protein